MTGRQAPHTFHLRRGSGSGANYQPPTHRFCGRGWNELLAKYPQDDAICALYATRRGLCTMVESRMIDLDRATRIFEDIRESLVGNYRDQSGPKEKKQAL